MLQFGFITSFIFSTLLCLWVVKKSSWMGLFYGLLSLVLTAVILYPVKYGLAATVTALTAGQYVMEIRAGVGGLVEEVGRIAVVAFLARRAIQAGSPLKTYTGAAAVGSMYALVENTLSFLPPFVMAVATLFLADTVRINVNQSVPMTALFSYEAWVIALAVASQFARALFHVGSTLLIGFLILDRSYRLLVLVPLTHFGLNFFIAPYIRSFRMVETLTASILLPVAILAIYAVVLSILHLSRRSAGGLRGFLSGNGTTVSRK